MTPFRRDRKFFRLVILAASMLWIRAARRLVADLPAKVSSTALRFGFCWGRVNIRHQHVFVFIEKFENFREDKY